MREPSEIIGYIGTYTKGASQGIYSFRLNTLAQTISEPALVAELTDPTYLSISNDQKHLYSIYKANGKGAIASFSIDQNTGELSLYNHSISENGSYCYLSVNNDSTALVAASYGDGMIESFTVLKDYSIGPVISTVKHEGKGPNIQRQEKAHAHYAQFTPDQKFIAVVDLGMDQILTYRLDQRQHLQLVHTLPVNPGSGPRHLVFHPNQRFAYVIAELLPEVIVLQYQKDKGSFKAIQTIRSVPEDFISNNQGSAIHISKDGRFVYTANRGHDSIAVFANNEDTGNLTLIQIIRTEGHWPRDFSLDPTEDFLVASNEESGCLTLFARNPESGMLTLLQDNIQVPFPVCVKFLEI